MTCKSCAERREKIKKFLKTTFRGGEQIKNPVKHEITQEYLNRVNRRFNGKVNK